MMRVYIFLTFLWFCTVYGTVWGNPREQPKRYMLSKSEPHPYTISFFTFPKGTQLLKSKKNAKRNNEEIPADNAPNVTSVKRYRPTSKKYWEKIDSGSNDTSKKETLHQESSEGNVSHRSNKISQPYVQVYENSTSLDKLGKAPNVGPQEEHQKTEPSKIGSSHDKIQIKVHQKHITDEQFQEGSIKHLSHTMYPECHHCPSNSSYKECTKATTLVKCNNGLNNICFTKSFRSKSRGVIYEMGCSNHMQCKKAKAKPCEGEVKKCFVCCQYNGCNAVPHHNLYTTDSADETEFSYLNEAAIYSSSKWITVAVVVLHVLTWL